MINKLQNGRWRVRVKHRGVVVANRVFDRKAEAAAWEAEQRRRLNDGDFVSPSAGRLTVAELAREYEDARRGQVAVRSWESDESALRVHIVPALGALPVAAVRAVDVERFLTNLAVSRSIRTAARVRTTLRGLFDYAVRTQRIRVSPATAVALPRPDSRTGESVGVNPFTLAELRAVVESQRSRPRQHESTKVYADVTLVLGLTGVRFGELRGLRVRDVVDVPYPAIVVQRSLPQSGRTGKVIVRTTTKGGRSRIVPLSDLVQPIVSSWVADKAGDDVLFPAPEGGYLARLELASRRPVGGDGPRAPAPRPSAHRRDAVAHRRRRRQDGVRLARALDRQTHPRHLRALDGNRRRSRCHREGECGLRGHGSCDLRGHHGDTGGA